MNRTEEYPWHLADQEKKLLAGIQPQRANKEIIQKFFINVL
jgi:hypothetical protein